MSEIPESYDPDSIEPKWRERWRDSDVYAYEGDPDRPDYVIDTPPPYPTGNLHIGNALGWCYMDFAARYRRLQGYDVDFPQGWDCHGLPTEVKVEENRGIHRTDVPREEFRQMCIEHTEEQIEAMRETMHTLGLSQDWTHEYVTMDPEYWGLTQRSFVEMADSGYVYRDEHPVNWCPRCETAIADAEVEPEERDGTLYYITFPDAGADGHSADDIEIATTRPELLAACVAIAVHPEDERYEGRAGETFEVPLFGQQVELVADPAVDPEFGTGAVMICTFGDKQDVEWWGEYDLDLRTVFTEDGHLTEAAGEFAGLTIDDAKDEIAAALDEAGYLLDAEPTEQSVGTCWRCDTPIEIMSTEQWFVRVDREEILDCGRAVEWIPGHMYDRLEDWTRGMDWDWVISRQRVFATPIPAWYCEDCGYAHLADVEEVPVDPTDAAPTVEACPECGGERWTGETDVMDTWMDSSITPLYLQGWPDDEFEPTALREQGHDIIRTWAFYTILRVAAIEDEVPWEEALINGMVFGDDGHKMSKSRGNFVQPEEVVDQYSADAFRQAIALGGQPGADIQFQWKEVKSASRFGTKLWNITRFAAEHVDEQTPVISDPAFRDADRWIRSRCARVADRVADHMDDYRFDAALRELREFVWHDLADDYLELVKGRLYEGRPGERNAARYALFEVLTASLTMLAPFAPFTTEEARSHLPTDGSVHAAAWPDLPEPDDGARRRGQLVADVAAAVRSWKSDRGIPLNADLDRIEIYFDGTAATAGTERTEGTEGTDRTERTERTAGSGGSAGIDDEPLDTVDTYDLSSAVNAPVYLETGRPDVELVPADVEIDHSTVGPKFRERADAVVAALEDLDPADVRGQLDTSDEVEVEIEVGIGADGDGGGSAEGDQREVVTVPGDALTVREEHRAGGEAVEVLDVDGATVLVFP